MSGENSTVNPNLALYVRQADATFRNNFEDEETKQLFLNNVFSEIAGSEVKLCLMKSCSFVLEQLVSSATSAHVLQLLAAFSKDLENVCDGQSSCHVIQKTLQQLVRLQNEADGGESDDWAEIGKTLKTWCKEHLFGEDKLLKMMCNVYSTHVVRSLIQTLGGVIFADDKHYSTKTSDKSSKDESLMLPESKLSPSFLFMISKLIAVLAKLDRKQVIELVTSPNGAPCVAVLLKVANIRCQKALKKLCRIILMPTSTSTLSRTPADNSGQLLLLCKDKIGSHVMETIMEVGSKKGCIYLHQAMCSNSSKFVELTCHPNANFVVQRMISCKFLQTEKYFSNIFGVLAGNMESILKANRMGVIQKLAEQCLLLSDYQPMFIQSLFKLFQCEDSEKKTAFVVLIATLQTYSTYFKLKKSRKLQINYHGSLLLQTLLKFEQTLVLAKSFLALPCDQMIEITCSASGSHLTDAFFTSTKIKKKHKRAVIDKLSGKNLCQLSCDKFGSRVIENIWKNSKIQAKVAIATKLTECDEQLSADRTGGYIYRNFGIRQFVQRRDEWESFQQQQISNGKRKITKTNSMFLGAKKLRENA